MKTRKRRRVSRKRRRGGFIQYLTRAYNCHNLKKSLKKMAKKGENRIEFGQKMSYYLNQCPNSWLHTQKRDITFMDREPTHLQQGPPPNTPNPPQGPSQGPQPNTPNPPPQGQPNKLNQEVQLRKDITSRINGVLQEIDAQIKQLKTASKDNIHELSNFEPKYALISEYLQATTLNFEDEFAYFQAKKDVVFAEIKRRREQLDGSPNEQTQEELDMKIALMNSLIPETKVIHEIQARKMTLMGVHYHKSDAILIGNGVNLMNYGDLGSKIKPQRTLILYNENVETFRDKTQYKATGGNSSARPFRLDAQPNRADALSLGIPTMTYIPSISLQNVLTEIDNAFQFIQYHIENSDVDLILWSGSFELDIYTDIFDKNKQLIPPDVYSGKQKILDTIKDKITALTLMYEMTVRNSDCNKNGYKRLLVERMIDSPLKTTLSASLPTPEDELKSLNAEYEGLIQADNDIELKKAECVYAEMQLINLTNHIDKDFFKQQKTPENELAQLLNKSQRTPEDELKLTELLKTADKESPQSTSTKSKSTSKSKSNQHLEVPPRIVDIDSSGDGNCFFRSVYISLSSKDYLLKLVNERLGFQNSNEAEFVRDIRAYLVKTDEYNRQLIQVFPEAMTEVAGYEDNFYFIDRVAEHNEYFRIINPQFTPDNAVKLKQEILDAVQGLSEYDLPKFLPLSNPQSGNYATPIEVQTLTNIFQGIGIDLRVDGVEFITRPNAIVIHKQGGHYHSYVALGDVDKLLEHFNKFSLTTQREIQKFTNQYRLLYL
jgi:hypothetical protein